MYFISHILGNLLRILGFLSVPHAFHGRSQCHGQAQPWRCLESGRNYWSNSIRQQGFRVTQWWSGNRGPCMGRGWHTGTRPWAEQRAQPRLCGVGGAASWGPCAHGEAGCACVCMCVRMCAYVCVCMCWVAQAGHPPWHGAAIPKQKPSLTQLRPARPSPRRTARRSLGTALALLHTSALAGDRFTSFFLPAQAPQRKF